MKAADDLHKEAMEQAHTILLDFIERMERAPTKLSHGRALTSKISTTLFLARSRPTTSPRITNALRFSIARCFSSASTSCYET